MKKLLIYAFICLATFVNAQAPDYNLTLVSNTNFPEDANDIWGYVDGNGVEYAVIGTVKGVRIYSLANPSSPELKANIPGDQSLWRDIKSYGDRLYVTTDTGQAVDEGLLIVNMSDPENITWKNWTPRLQIGTSNRELRTCHNIYIDEETGRGFLAGCNTGNKGVVILDLTQNPDEPVFIGAVDDYYSHDVYTDGDILYSSNILEGTFGIYNIENPAEPKLLGESSTSTFFTHNSWADDDNNFLFTTDERANAYVDAFDVTDKSNPIFLDKYQPLETKDEGVIPHNTHYKDGFLYTSWYTSGVKIIDANDPSNLVEVGSYDTYLGPNGGFGGCWGAYPFLPSGLLLLSDIESGLFVLDVNINKASTIGGTVTSLLTGEIINNVKVEIVDDKMNEAYTDAEGNYKTGLYKEGVFTVRFSHLEYQSQEVEVELKNGELVNVNVQLGSLLLQGGVVDANGNAIDGADFVLLSDRGEKIFSKTDENGNAGFDIFPSHVYEGYVAKWGYKPATFTIKQGKLSTEKITLEEGYQDDFIANLGWTISGDAAEGAWEVNEPILSTYDGSTIVTDGDLSSDVGFSCLLTGANQGGVGSNDIDGGVTVATSPTMDFTNFKSANISFSYFFTYVLSAKQFDDNFKVELTNGITSIELLNTTESTSDFVEFARIINYDMIDFNDRMQIVVTASDTGNPQLVEAQFDGLNVELSTKTGVEDIAFDSAISIFPNPTTNGIYVESTEPIKRIRVIDATGNVIIEEKISSFLNLSNLSNGLYIIELESSEGALSYKRVMKY